MKQQTSKQKRKGKKNSTWRVGQGSGPTPFGARGSPQGPGGCRSAAPLPPTPLSDTRMVPTHQDRAVCVVSGPRNGVSRGCTLEHEGWYSLSTGTARRSVIVGCWYNAGSTICIDTYEMNGVVPYQRVCSGIRETSYARRQRGDELRSTISAFQYRHTLSMIEKKRTRHATRTARSST
eukprot:1938530-Rhodomonas_salina.1